MTTQLTWVPLAVLNTAGARDFMQASPDKHHNKVNTEWYKLLPNKPLTSSLPLTQDDQRGYYQQTILDWSRTAIKTRQLAPVVNTLLSLRLIPVIQDSDASPAPRAIDRNTCTSLPDPSVDENQNHVHTWNSRTIDQRCSMKWMIANKWRSRYYWPHKNLVLL